MSAVPTDAPGAPFPANPRENPFPGLRSFEPDEDHLFFGRETQVDRLLGLLRETRLLAVVGTSGSGKSSLIRSGLIPSLYSGYMAEAGSSWRVAIFRPGEDPIGNLAAALADPEVLAPEDDEPELLDMHRGLLEATLHRGDLGLVECRRLASIPPRDNLLVIADQFEELFRFRENRSLGHAAEASASFVKLLLEAATQKEVPVYVVLTMRSEWVGHCTEFVGFAEAINRGYFLIPRMTRQERREAIVGPVMVAGAEISPRLVTRLLNEVGEDPDQLPILQHALMRIWDDYRARGNDDVPIDIDHYEAVGTLERALDQHAEEAFAELDPGGQELAGRVFRALTDRGSGGRRVRSPRRMEELCELTGADLDDLVSVVEPFRLPGRAFLMPPHGTPLTKDSILDISHESLMRVWERLREWVEEESRSAQVYLRLAKAAERHQQGKGGLWRDPELQTALNWREEARPNERWAERYDPSFTRAIAFLEASRQERDEQRRRREHRRRRQLAWMRRIALGAAVAALAMALLGLYALDRKAVAESLHEEALAGRREAERERGIAVEQREIAQVQRRKAEQQKQRAEEQKQIAEEQKQIAEVQERAAVAGRREAEVQRSKAEEQRREAEAQKKRAEEESLRAQREEKRAQAAKEVAEREERRAEARRRQTAARSRAGQVLRFSEDQTEQATAVALEAYRRYREAERDLGDTARPGAYDPSLYSALYRAWGRSARDQAGDETGSYVTALRSRTPWTASYHEDAVRVLAVAPRGPFLASGDDAGRVTLLDFDADPFEAGPAIELRASGSPIRALVWSPDGKALAAGGLDGTLHLWNFGAGSRVVPESWSTRICPREDDDCRLRDLVFVREARSGAVALLSADSNGTLRSRRPVPGRESAESAGALPDTGGEPVVALATARDGHVLAVGHERSVRLFELRGEPRDSWRLVATLPVPARDSRLSSLALRHDATALVVGTEGGLLLFFEIRDGEARSNGREAAHKSAVTAVDFAAGAEVLASTGRDGSVLLWRFRHGKLNQQDPIQLEDHEGWVWDVALTAAGDRVISGGQDRKILIRPTSASALFEDLCAHSPDSCDAPLASEEAGES